ncbi:vacuolar amino acid transporter 2 [Diutina catenulata]
MANKYEAVPQEEPQARADQPQGSSRGESIELQDFDLSHEEPLDLEAEDPGASSSPDEGTSNMSMAFMNMANSILGAGIIGQPFAFKNTGLVGGIIVMIFLTWLIDWTLRLIVVNAEKSHTSSYQDTVTRCFGRPGRLLLLVSISLFAYGGCMAFCVIIGDTIPHVLRALLPEWLTTPAAPWGFLFKRNSIIIIFTAGISFPLSLNRDISKLAKASGFALVGMTVIVVLTIVRAPFAGADQRGQLTKPEWTVNSSIFQGISVISFALVCHHNTIYIYNSLRNATIKKFAKITHLACVVSMVFCGLMAINGLVTFGDKTKGNVLNNFRADDVWINIARFCFGLNMLTTFPLEIYVVRDVLKDVVLTANEDGETGDLEMSRNQHVIITTLLVFTSMSVSLFTCNLGIILELIGSTSASLMAYIIPPMCYIKLCYDELDTAGGQKVYDRRFVVFKALPSAATVVFGMTVMIVSTIGSLSKAGSDDGQCLVD